MGLDQYLYAKPHGDKTADVYRTEEEMEALPDEDKVGDYWKRPGVIDVGYWRKANQIHAWFVEHVQNGVDECEPHFVGLNSLVRLYNTCKEVMEDSSRAPQLLSTASGFFFGSDDYGPHYFAQVKETIDILAKIVVDPEFADMDFVYQSSW